MNNKELQLVKDYLSKFNLYKNVEDVIKTVDAEIEKNSRRYILSKDDVIRCGECGFLYRLSDSRSQACPICVELALFRRGTSKTIMNRLINNPYRINDMCIGTKDIHRESYVIYEFCDKCFKKLLCKLPNRTEGDEYDERNAVFDQYCAPRCPYKYIKENYPDNPYYAEEYAKHLSKHDEVVQFLWDMTMFYLNNKTVFYPIYFLKKKGLAFSNFSTMDDNQDLLKKYIDKEVYNTVTTAAFIELDDRRARLCDKILNMFINNVTDDIVTLVEAHFYEKYGCTPKQIEKTIINNIAELDRLTIEYLQTH